MIFCATARSFILFLLYVLASGIRALAGENVDIAVLVVSDNRPESFELRTAARATWLRLAQGRPFSYAFCLAVSHDSENLDALMDEASNYHDILVVRGVEDYQRLPSKVFSCFSALSAIAMNVNVTSWIVNGFSLPQVSPFDFAIKTDHDVFLRLDSLYSELSSELANVKASPKASPYLSWRGFVYSSIPPLRDLSDKNADVSLPLMSFPPYTAGVCVILSTALLHQLLQISSPLMPLNEDQALGLWITQRETELGAATVHPTHDNRFQQWDVCTPSQLAIHPANPFVMRTISENIIAGRGQCEGLFRRKCGLCGFCSVDEQQSWFLCSDETGASLSDFDTIDEVLRIRWGQVRLAQTPQDLRSLMTRALSNLLSQAGASQGAAALSSPWQAMAPKQSQSAVVDVTSQATGVNVTCTSCDSSRSDSCEYRPLCGVSFPFSPPSHVIMPAHPVNHRPLHRYRGHYFGALSPPTFECDVEHGHPRMDPFFFTRLYKEMLTIGEKKSLRLGQKPRQRVAEAPSARWILIAAKVNTLGACTFSGLSPSRRLQKIMYESFEMETLQGYPRLGASAAHCTFVIDIVHDDGRVTVRYSPLARDAAEHLHFELLRVTYDAPIMSVYVTLLLPDDNAQSAQVSVRELSVFDLRLPRWLLPPGRVASEKMRNFVDVARLRADKRLISFSKEVAASWRPIQRGVVVELPLPDALSMPACAHGAWHLRYARQQFFIFQSLFVLSCLVVCLFLVARILHLGTKKRVRSA